MHNPCYIENAQLNVCVCRTMSFLGSPILSLKRRKSYRALVAYSLVWVNLAKCLKVKFAEECEESRENKLDLYMY